MSFGAQTRDYAGTASTAPVDSALGRPTRDGAALARVPCRSLQVFHCIRELGGYVERCLVSEMSKPIFLETLENRTRIYSAVKMTKRRAFWRLQLQLTRSRTFALRPPGGCGSKAFYRLLTKPRSPLLGHRILSVEPPRSAETSTPRPMFQKVFALGLVASACAAGPAAGNNLRLRGGFAGYGKLTDLPSTTPTPPILPREGGRPRPAPARPRHALLLRLRAGADACRVCNAARV